MIAGSSQIAGDSAPGDLIVATFRRVLAEAGPRQAEVLRRCAAPRWWDREVLAALRESGEGNQRVLELLAGYSFVRPLGGGRYAYPDEVRAALLAEWQARRPGELRAINLGLAAHFEARVAAALPAEMAPSAAGATISARPTGDWELWRREALYHRLMADPADGLARLRAAFDEAESTCRLAEAESLLQVAADARLDEAGLMWLRYMRARLDRAALRLDESAEQLESLLSAPALDPALAAEANRALADVLAETGQWARAVELYRGSLAYFERSGDRRAAAEAMLRLGEAYRGIGINTGGWHVPALSHLAIGRALGRAWYGLLALPFYLVAWLLRRTPWTLPRPRYLAPYQNWPLIRIYRTAQGWYERARAEFAALNDPVGLLRAERQQIEILLLFGYAGDALARLDDLLARPAARDPYRRLWLQGDRAGALIELGQGDAARAMLDETLAGFRAIGDFRGEAAMLALRGRAAADAGAADAALASYEDSLARFRALRYAAARELALYALRAWQRRVGPGAIADRIGGLLDREPEKRYVARFPRSLLPLLQALVLGVVPLALLISALVAPTRVVQTIGDTSILETRNVYNLWNAAGALLLIGALSLAVYTAVALALIFVIPLAALEREQPDYLITGAQGIARYDYRGALAERIGWADLSRWIRVDRRIWRRPIALFSLAFLEAADGRDLRIDGIVGWYGGLQRDIALHLRAAGSATREEDWGYSLLRSKSGALLVVGIGLLLLCVWTANGWSQALLGLGPGTYSAINLLALSGVLIVIPLAYWLVTRPLALVRALDLRDRWPWFVGAAGLGAVLLYLLSGGGALPDDALNVGVLLAGAYAVADAAYTLLLPRRRLAGYALIAAALLGAGAWALPKVEYIYNDNLGKFYARQLESPANPGDVQPGPSAGGELPTDVGRAETWARIGDALYRQERYRDAIIAYDRSLALIAGGADQAGGRQATAQILLRRALALRAAGDPDWQRDFQAACALVPALCRGVSP